MFGSPGGLHDADSSLPAGEGGGIISMVAPFIEVNGDIIVDGTSPSHSSSGGGSGGSIFMTADVFRGHGTLSANGGASSSQQTDFPGGGGGGGRVAVHFNEMKFAGEISCHGGESLSEAGGPGTVLLYDTDNGTFSLYVDNDHTGKPTLDTDVDYLPGSRTSSSSRAWLLPAIDGRVFNFEKLSLAGDSHLAIDHDSDFVTVDVKHSQGDQTGLFHVGPYQVFTSHLIYSTLEEHFNSSLGWFIFLLM